MAHELREYQVEGIDMVRDSYRSGKSAPILVAPTGAGKTTIACRIIENACARGHRVIFLAHRKELIDQCSRRLDDNDIDHGIIKSGNNRVNSLPVQVASLMTLLNRVEAGKRKSSIYKSKYQADLFIIDECHRATATSYLRILQEFPDAKLLGLTATPYRSDGKGLNILFDDIVECSNPQDLTDMGFLVPARYFTTPMTLGLENELKSVKKTQGDYNAQELEKVIDKATIIGDIYEHWAKYASDRKTVIFASSRKHAANILEAFEARGTTIAYIDGDTPERERDDRLAALYAGRVQCIVNVGILTEGWDCPAVSCVCLARPTQSEGLYRQMVGRALRSAKEKKDCIILDHGGNVRMHGFVTDAQEFSLEGVKGTKKTPSVTTCKACFAVYSSKKTECPECGGKDVSNRLNQGRDLPETGQGELVEVNHKDQRQEEVDFFKRAYADQELKKYNENYACVKFKEKFGRWPGKEIGLKKKWKRVTNDKGQLTFKLAGWEFGARNKTRDTIDIGERLPMPVMEVQHR